MRPSRLREMGDTELQEQLAELRKDLFQARFRAGQDEVEERGKTRKLRQEVARIMTVLRERQLGLRGRGTPAGGKES